MKEEGKQFGKWIQTDDLQWRKDISSTKYDLVEVRSIPTGEYLVVYGMIDLTCYMAEDYESTVKSYYGSVKEFEEMIPEEARNGILAECIFEELQLSEVSVRSTFFSEDEAKRDALKYMVEEELPHIKQPESTLPDAKNMQKWMIAAAIYWGNTYSDCMSTAPEVSNFMDGVRMDDLRSLFYKAAYLCVELNEDVEVFGAVLEVFFKQNGIDAPHLYSLGGVKMHK